ncbi:MAG: phage baseplate assembly protein V [Tannerella sp.]|jgi:hypothetical protein|nr:phage baseplate assembly protein V [Tannerella sp.]
MKRIDFPKAYPQLALVKFNNDEKKLGRVKAEFQWQKNKGRTTNWIRFQTPDAGPNPEPGNTGISCLKTGASSLSPNPLLIVVTLIYN